MIIYTDTLQQKMNHLWHKVEYLVFYNANKKRTCAKSFS